MDCELIMPVKNLAIPPAPRRKSRKSRHGGGSLAGRITHIGHGALSCRAVLEAGPLLTWLMTGCAALWREKYWSI